MRGNWEEAEPYAVAPDQQQQNSGSIMKNHPYHSATTPAWGGRIVKAELTEEKNNDLPEDYSSNSCSPTSRHSSGNSSPGSSESRDSTAAIPSTDYNYSTSGIFNNHTTKEVNDNQPMDLENGPENLPCPMCPLVFSSGAKLNEHFAANHSSQSQTPEYLRSVMIRQLAQLSPTDGNTRASPSPNEEKIEHEFLDIDDPGIRTPRLNSQGKVKTYRCKQCDFVAITKLKFWEHSKVHIKLEKRLGCPKCPFVTEYKHHLEYHMRNHLGSKPFKCDRCVYTCVNKSMLKSHMKSHSSIYQYRCANCIYATKYCHSLKLHLRKYRHEPAQVLNADGTPNPNPIIDVYGTRRGPKAKPSPPPPTVTNPEENLQVQNLQVIQPQIIQPQISPIAAAINPLAMANVLGNGINSMVAYQYNQLYSAGFPMANNYENKDNLTQQQIENLKKNIFAEYAKAVAAERIKAEVTQESLKPNETLNNNSSAAAAAVIEENIPAEKKENDDDNNKIIIPLDLSKPDINNDNNNDGNVEDNYQQDSGVQNLTTSVVANSPKSSGTSRRKGKAVKLDRQIVEQESENEEVPSTAEGNAENNKSKKIQLKIGDTILEFACTYCDMAFGNEVMFTVHMGYHGFNDPYTCNMCGQRCIDKVALFLHICRSSH